MPSGDISSMLISKDAILERLPSIFIDSIVVDQNFNVVIVSQNVLQFLEFTNEELKGKNVNYLAGSEDLCSRLKSEIANGFFEEHRAKLFCKTNRSVQVGISGFYLGLISDINGFIILKVRNFDDVDQINQQLKNKTAELDKFIYRTAHDLRGPLATIKGLINLLKMRDDNNELDRLICLIDLHANKLDDRLFQLVYLAQTDREVEMKTVSELDFTTLETTLRKIIEQNAFVDFLEFHYCAPQSTIQNIDEQMLSALLSNMLLYFLSLQMGTVHVQLFYRLQVDDNNLNITIAAQGFETNPALRAVIHESESMYTDLLHYPQLMNFYAAQKIAFQFGTKIKIEFVGAMSQRVGITIPLRKRSH
jgi:signal transduction histidine kinase